LIAADGLGLGIEQLGQFRAAPGRSPAAPQHVILGIVSALTVDATRDSWNLRPLPRLTDRARGPADTKLLRDTVAATLAKYDLGPWSDNPRGRAMPRELITPKGDKRFVRRSKGGQFKESDDVARSLASDRRKKAKTIAKKGEGDRGDQRRP
jgi:hypothetical protein